MHQNSDKNKMQTHKNQLMNTDYTKTFLNNNLHTSWDGRNNEKQPNKKVCFSTNVADVLSTYMVNVTSKMYWKKEKQIQAKTKNSEKRKASSVCLNMYVTKWFPCITKLGKTWNIVLSSAATSHRKLFEH